MDYRSLSMEEALLFHRYLTTKLEEALLFHRNQIGEENDNSLNKRAQQ